MSKVEYEDFENAWNKVGCVALIIIPLMMFPLFLFKPSEECLSESVFYNRKIQGVVKNRFYDIKNHSVETVTISFKGKYNQNFIVNIDSSGFFDYINLHDSVFKPLHELKVIVYRDNVDTTFIIDYGCDEN